MANERVVVKARHNVPLVTIALAVRGGVLSESAERAGLTGIMARTSIKGTAQRSARQIAELAENMGGSVSPSVSADVFDWEITVPSRHFERAFELLCDVALNARFPADEFAIERKLALADLQQTRDDMYRYPLRLCLQQAFRGHVYGNTMEDVERTLTRVSAEDVAAWHAQQLAEQPWVFVVGDIDPDAVMRIAAEYIPARPVAEHDAPTSVWRGAAQVVESRDKAQTALALAFPGPDRNDPDSYALSVLANAVGGLGGRFFEELRSKRSLAYSVALLPIARWRGGAFVSYIATSPEREAEARSALLEQFARLREEELPLSEVERSQRYMIGTWQIRSQTNGAQLGDILHAYLLGEGMKEVTEYEERIRAVTPAAIQAAAQRYFDPNVLVEGIVRGAGHGR